MRRFLLLLALVLTLESFYGQYQASAQAVYPKNAIILGRGPGVQGFGYLLSSGGTGQCLLNNGAGLPIFTTCPSVSTVCLTQGQIYYRDASTQACLSPGSAGTALISGGAGANPSWTGSAIATMAYQSAASVAITGGTAANLTLTSATVSSGTVSPATFNASVTGDITMTSGGATTIANDAVTTVKILAQNVTTAKIADDAVTNAKLANMAAVTLKGNPTAGSTDPTDFTISGLTSLVSPDATADYLLIWDHTAGTFKKVNPGTIASAATAGVASLGGLTGALLLGTGLSSSGSTVNTPWTIFTNDIRSNNSGTVGVGAVANYKFGVSSNAAALPAATPTGTMVQVSNADATNTRILVDAFGAGFSSYDLRRANGTAASPTAVQNNDLLGQIAWFGRGATTYSANSLATVAANAAENWTDAAQGAYITFWTTITGSITRAERMRILATGAVRIGFYAACYSLLGSTSVGDLICAGGPNSILATGADATGAADSKAAIDTACDLLTHVRVPKGTYKISASVTYSNCNFIFDKGGIFKPASGQTVAIRKVPTMGPYQIADHSAGGTVTGIRDVWPENWGAVNDNSTADITYLAAAEASVREGGLNGSEGSISRIQFTCGPGYKVASTWTVNLKSYNPIQLGGCGAQASTIIGATGGTFTTGIVNLIGDTSGALDFSLKDFGIKSQTNNEGTQCLNFNNNVGTYIASSHQNKVARLYLSGCNTLIGMFNTRQITFEAMGLWMPYVASTYGIYTDALEADSSVGDIDVIGGQVVCDSINNGVGTGIRFRSAASNSSANGWRFHGFVFYHCNIGVDAYAGAGGGIGDHFYYPGTQFEGVNMAVNYETHGATARQIFNLYFNGVYINALNGTAPAMRFAGDVSHAIGNVNVAGTQARGQAAGTSANFITFSSGFMLNVANNQIIAYQKQSGVNELIRVTDSDHIVINGNNATLEFPDSVTPVLYLVGYYGTVDGANVNGNMSRFAVTATCAGAATNSLCPAATNVP